MSVEKFASIFDGLAEAYGYFKISGRTASGKNTGKAGIIRGPRTMRLYEEHLSGSGTGLGIIPINADNMCKWGCIDVDQYPLDHKLLVEKINTLKLPLVVCRSKSGGAHCFLFSKEWVAASDMQNSLRNIAAAIGYGNSEIFPKQIKLHLDRGDVGNFLNLPYYNDMEGLRYAILDDGSAATLDEFIGLYEKACQTPEQIVALQTTETKKTSGLEDAPPCLQILLANKISEGSRNNGLFNVGVYLRKAFPDSWETEILSYNMKYLSPPLALPEVMAVAKQLGRKEYAYKCGDSPINSHCNKELCRTRKHGIGGPDSGATVANLRKYNSAPPVWFMDVNGEPLELDTEGLLSQAAFQKACLEQLNFMPRTQTKIQWENRIAGLLNDMKENEGAIMEVAPEASVNGRLYDHLEEFCSGLQQAKDKEEILLRRPWTDEETSKTYFRLRDFEDYLKQNKLYEYKPHKIAQRLRDIGGESMVLKIRGRGVRVWFIPSYDKTEIEIKTAEFSTGSPF